MSLAHAVDRPRAVVRIIWAPGCRSFVGWECPLCGLPGAIRDFNPEYWDVAIYDARRHMRRAHGYEPIPAFRPLPRARRRRLGAVVDLTGMHVSPAVKALAGELLAQPAPTTP